MAHFELLNSVFVILSALSGKIDQFDAGAMQPIALSIEGVYSKTEFYFWTESRCEALVSFGFWRVGIATERRKFLLRENT